MVDMPSTRESLTAISLATQHFTDPAVSAAVALKATFTRSNSSFQSGDHHSSIFIHNLSCSSCYQYKSSCVPLEEHNCIKI
ncbi:hypothetical protein J437_LFUL008436 [Ladona fulva]|uniref:Uncharacterized protein n=1 Tax=Ladona fulva TaxID=123851 RepID=A0A8K0NX04_LADFU|nr:hypothetical protein J437_LFUL008436 [Ladona fulva]